MEIRFDQQEIKTLIESSGRIILTKNEDMLSLPRSGLVLQSQISKKLCFPKRFFVG
jgi:hypothetical protein